MSVVSGPVTLETIRAFKGTLDFYHFRGQLCVRGWPRKPAMPRALAVQLSGQDFADTVRALSNIPADLLGASQAATTGTLWTWRDAWLAALYGNGPTWQ